LYDGEMEKRQTVDLYGDASFVVAWRCCFER
jgi:hypothetical protein